MIGQTLGHYRITAKIGAGGMGEVYRATDTKLHRDVAVKVIPEAFATDHERMTRFEREAQVLASLSHGSIAAIHGIEDSNGKRAIIMELVVGEDLSDRLKRGPLPLDEALRTAAHIAAALEVAHDRGVIHRDLKPANIKLLESGDVKLLDFGLAKALEDAGPQHLNGDAAATLSAAQTRAGIILGTAAYMSPEQATGGAADKRSDVWSFGVVLFEMLTGQRLFDGQTTSHVLADVIRAEIDFDRLPADLPPDLRTLIELLLVRDPRRRLRDIREARLVLERLLERGTARHSVVTSGVLLAPAGPRRGGWRAHLPWMAAAALVAALLGVAAAIWWRPAAVAPPVLHLTTELHDGRLYEDVGPAFDLSPDGRRVVFSAIDSPTSGRLLVRDLDRFGSAMLVDLGRDTDAGVRPYNPFFSPDGQWVGYTMRSALRKVSSSGGPSVTLAPLDRGRGAAWTPDGGDIVFAYSTNTGLSIVSSAGGEPRPLTTLDAAQKEATHRWPFVLPGGEWVLFNSHTSVNPPFDDAVIHVVSLKTGARKVVHRGGTYPRYLASGHLLYLHRNTLVAAPLDLDALSPSGPPVPLLQNVAVSTNGAGQIAIAPTGVTVYRTDAGVARFGIAWLDRSGRQTPLYSELGLYGKPRLSPDGQRLSVTAFKDGDWDVWTIDLDRKIAARATSTGPSLDSEQEWSPDGRELAYASELPGTDPAIYRKPYDGSGAGERIYSGAEILYPQDWTADGQTLLVASQNKIAVLSLTGSPVEPTWIAGDAPGVIYRDAALSPDGRWLAYVALEQGNTEVFIQSFPSDSVRRQISSGGGRFPRWTRGGRELVFRTDRGIAAVTVDVSGDSLRASRPELLFQGHFMGGLQGVSFYNQAFADFDVLPDGSRFVMFPQPDDGGALPQGLVNVISNLFDHFKLR